jgi:hypothetical protein
MLHGDSNSSILTPFRISLSFVVEEHQHQPPPPTKQHSQKVKRSRADSIIIIIMDDNKVTDFRTKMFGLCGGVITLTMARLGKELGLFEALQQQSSGMTSADLANHLKLSPRHTYEWCLQMTGSGFLEYVEATDKFILPPEHASILCTDEGIAAMIPALVENTSYQYPLLKLAYESNGGIFWGDMRGMTTSTKMFFKPVYEKMLPLWIDLSPELKAMLSTKGCKVADIGCGCGVSTRSLGMFSFSLF